MTNYYREINRSLFNGNYFFSYVIGIFPSRASLALTFSILVVVVISAGVLLANNIIKSDLK